MVYKRVAVEVFLQLAVKRLAKGNIDAERMTPAIDFISFLLVHSNPILVRNLRKRRARNPAFKEQFHRKMKMVKTVEPS